MKQKSVPMLILGETRRKDLTAQLSSRIQGWLKEWAAQRSVDVTVELTDEVAAIEPGLHGSQSVVASSEGAPHLAVIASNGLWSGVSGTPDRASNVGNGNGAIAGRVYTKMLHALAETLVSGLPMKIWQVESLSQRSTADAQFTGTGWYAVKIALGDKRECLSLLLSSSLIVQLAPREVKSSGGVSRRRSAVANESIRVEAVLGEAAVSIGDLATLAVNDVIMLRDDVPNVCYLQTEKGKPVANISLGRLGSKRAALIVSNRT